MGFKLINNIDLSKNREMICLQHFYNKSYVAGCYWLLLLGQKSNLSVSFKFEPITTNHLWFVVKML